MVLAHDWTADGLPADIIKGAVLITGVMDCEPVLDITVNEGVRLEPVAARRLSPPRNPPQRALPLLIAVRGAEPPLWNKMSQDYAVPCRADSIECGYMDTPSRDLRVSSLVNATLTMISPLIRVFIDVISRGIFADTARADPGKRTIQAGPQHGARILMTLEPMARNLGALLKKRGETVAVIESSTGGLISAALLSIPGASAYFVGGAVTYTGAARHALLALPAELPAETRSSSEPYAQLGARAIRERLGTTWGLAETGAAGPSGNRYGDAAGHTCLAVCGPIERVLTLETGRDDREDNMWVFARTAIGLLYEAVRGV